jgi:hypothetical protein
MKYALPVALVLLALAIILPGIAGLVAPTSLPPSLIGIDAFNEARAAGGTRLGVALILLLAAFRPPWRRAGLVAGCVVFGATLAGRVLSNGLDGMPTAMLKPEIAEAILIAIALVALRVTSAATTTLAEHPYRDQT